MANSYIPAEVERGCDPCRPTRVEQKAFLGGVLGIDVNGERQPISEAGIVDLTFIEEETREAAEQAIASAQAAAESEQTASEAAASARSSESAAQTAANAAEAAKADAEDAARSANSSKNTADSYATAAQTAAAAAQIADGNAERSAESAIAAAAQAASSAGAAQQYANEAYTSASTAQTASGAAQDAQTAAEASASTASSAATTATQAKTAAQAAQAGAEAARSAAASSATAASGSATAAAGSAAQAAASATAADASAAAAAQSAAAAQAAAMDVIDKAPIITDTASGAIASFPDGSNAPIKQLTVGIEPQQDLHGYDNPWPGGASKNQFNADAGSNGYIDNSGTVQYRSYQFASDFIAVTAGSQYTISAASQMANIGIAWFDSNKAIILPRADNASRQTLTITPPTGAAYVRFWFYKDSSTDLNPTNVKDTYKVQFESGSTATAFAPYSNDCPITGWTGANVTGASVNIWDEEWELGILDGHGVEQPSTNAIRAKEFIPILPNNKYYVVSGSGKYVYGFFYNADKVKVGAVNIRNSVFTAPSNAYYFRFSMGSEYGATYNNDISINAPYTDTEYHSYAGTSYPITWQSEAGTVYGGSLTVEEDGTGTLSVDEVEIDLSAKSWSYISETAGQEYFRASAGTPKPIGATLDAHCSSYKVVAGSSVSSTDFSIGVNANAAYIYVRDPRFTNKTAFAQSLIGVRFTCPIVTPVTYTLTASQMRTLLGQNNWWADCGDIAEINYRCDTRKFIEKKLAALLAALS